MESGLPMLNCLLQHSLRSICLTSQGSSKWVYAVFWKILPRNYPPPKWDYGGGSFERSKGNKRNWILVWEDGFCNFNECERAPTGERFGTDVFFKMSHEVYCFGEGLIGNIAADNSHKWVFRNSPADKDPNLLTSCNVSIDPQPKAWQIQFHSGIQTIAVISVREGLIQLGSFEKVEEDLNLVVSIRRKFSNLLSLPGFYAAQRSCRYLPIQNPYSYIKEMNFVSCENLQLTGLQRVFDEKFEEFPLKSLNVGYNSPQNGPPIWPIPPLFPSMPCSFGTMSSESPFEGVNVNGERRDKLNFGVKTEPFCVVRNEEKGGEDKLQGLKSSIRM